MDINRYTPSYGVNHKHLVSLSDFSTEEIFEFLYATKAMKAKFYAHEDTKILQNTTVALLFGDASIRTRSALEIGVRQLGGSCVDLPYSEEDIRTGENVKDVVNVISRYGVGAIVTRGVHKADLNDFCSHSEISIINSTNEQGMPMQTVCDLFTIWEKKGKLDGVKLAFVGKRTNNAASLIAGAVKCGLEVTVATPAEFAFDKECLDDARQFGAVTVTENPVDPVRGADVVYTDGYNYDGALGEKELKILAPYQVNNKLMSFAAHNAQFMHALPACRGLEVTPEVIDGKNSLVLEQGENKLHAIKSVLALLI